jgi:integrase
MGSIEHRPDRPKPYRARYWGLDGRQHHKSFARKYDAEAWLTAQEASKLDNTWTAPARGRIRFADWAAEWWQDWSPGKAPATLEATEIHLRLHIRPYFDRRQLNTIDAQVVQRWQNELAGKMGHELLMACRSILNRILEAAKVNRRIPINPVRLVPVPSPRIDPDAILGHVRRRAFTPEEFGRLLACTSRFYWDHFITQVGTGLRSGELLGLQPDRVLLDQARLEVVDVRFDAGRFGSGYRNRPKTIASIRPVPLAPIVVEAVTRKLDGCPSDGRVFCGPGGSNGIRRGVRSHLSTGNYRRVYHQAVEAAALTALDLHGPHDLRSTYATLLEVGSIPVRVIDELMGHRSGGRGQVDAATVGAHYRHTTPAMLDRVIETVETYLHIALASVPQACPRPKQQGRHKGNGHRRSGS